MSTGTPSAEAQNTRLEICDYRLKSPFISETIQDRPIVTTEQRHTDSLFLFVCFEHLL